MRYLTLLAGVLSIGSSVFAAEPQCPKLEGHYSCTGKVRDFSKQAEIRQGGTATAPTYELPFRTDADRNDYIFTADGIVHEQKARDPYLGELETTRQAVCGDGSALTTTVTIPLLGVLATTTYTLSADRLTISNLIKVGDADPIREESICTRI